MWDSKFCLTRAGFWPQSVLLGWWLFLRAALMALKHHCCVDVPSCLLCSSEHSQKDCSLRRYHFTWMLWGWGSNLAVAACTAQGATKRTGKGAVWWLFVRAEMLYLPSESLRSEHWSRGWDIAMRHQWDRMPSSAQGSANPSLLLPWGCLEWLILAYALIEAVMLWWSCDVVGKEREQGKTWAAVTLCSVMRTLAWGVASWGSAAGVAYVFHVKAFIEKTSCSLKNIARKECWLHMDEGFFWKVYIRNNFRYIPVFSVFCCLK